jgi:MinD superfamily P-loop ATPase
MATNLRNVMTWDQAVEQFNESILPQIQEKFEQDGIKDLPARREIWNNWTDSLCKNEQISDWQYNNWSHPSTCEGCSHPSTCEGC